MPGATDSIQSRLTDYACTFDYRGLTPQAIRAAKARIIDTCGALVAGFFGEPCRNARALASQMPNSAGATIIGTRMKTTPDMAAFVNATTARYAEMMDSYHGPGSAHGHASEIITPVLAAGEHARVNGRELITAIVLGYEVFLRISDVFHNKGFDTTNFACIGTAVAAGKLLRLSPVQLAHCISMAVVPNVILRQMRLGELTMFRTLASGHAGRAGVFAALLARAGMEGPHLPFEGKAGWCEHVARERFSLDALGGDGTPFKITDTLIKLRPAEGNVISCILAAEEVAPLNPREVSEIIVEIHRHAIEHARAGPNPDSKETADHSIPYIVAAALLDGKVTPRSYNRSHLSDPQLRALAQKVQVIENEEFTKAYARLPQEHRTRVTVITQNGKRLVGEVGGDQDDMAMPKSDAQIEEKFRGLTEDVMSVKKRDAILNRLWHLEEIDNVGEIPPAFVLD